MPAAEGWDERRVEVGAGRLGEPQHAERGERLGHRPRLEACVRCDGTDGAHPRDLAALDDRERRPRHVRRAEGGARGALHGYWQASHSSPLRAASIEHAAAATRDTVGPSIREAPSVRR